MELFELHPDTEKKNIDALQHCCMHLDPLVNEHSNGKAIHYWYLWMDIGYIYIISTLEYCTY